MLRLFTEQVSEHPTALCLHGLTPVSEQSGVDAHTSSAKIKRHSQWDERWVESSFLSRGPAAAPGESHRRGFVSTALCVS